MPLPPFSTYYRVITKCEFFKMFPFETHEEQCISDATEIYCSKSTTFLFLSTHNFTDFLEVADEPQLGH